MVTASRRSVLLALPVLGLTACGQSAGDSASSSPAAAGGVRTEGGYQLNGVRQEAPTVTLYTDLQCPYCAKADPAFRQAAAQLEGTMNVTVRHFPLPMHANAVPAAQAVQAAEAQGAYLAMADHLFKRQDTWKGITDINQLAQLLGDYAEQLGFDRARFEADLVKEENLNLIEQEYKDGVASGVSGTPSFVVDGVKVEGVDSSTSAEDMVAAFKKQAGL